MAVYKRDQVSPDWEPSPWPMDTGAADEQERGFRTRAQMPIRWEPIPWEAFPEQGISGYAKDWLASIDAAHFASFGDEDLILIDNTWFGWPDPPRWGLASRPCGQHDRKWDRWGHFPDLPTAWDFPIVILQSDR